MAELVQEQNSEDRCRVDTDKTPEEHHCQQVLHGRCVTDKTEGKFDKHVMDKRAALLR